MVQQHRLTGTDRGYAFVAEQNVIVDGMTCVVFTDAGQIKLAAIGIIIGLNTVGAPIRAALGDEVELDGLRGRIANIQRPGGRRGLDFDLGLERVA